MVTFGVHILLRYNRSTSRKIIGLPGPVKLPLIGNMHQLIWNKHTSVVFRWIHQLLKELDTDILCLRFGSVNVIVIACPEIALEVAREKDAVFVSRPTTFASETLSFGYMGSTLTPDVQQWKKMRRVIRTEILSPALEKQLHHLREEEIDHMVKCIYNTCNSNNIVNVRHVARHFCGNMIRKLMFSKRYFTDQPADHLSADGPGPNEVEHVGALFTMLSHVYSFSISDYFPSLVGLNFDGQEKVVKREIVFAIIDNPPNEVEWALAEMINKPEVMKKAIDELDKVVGKDRLVQESDISQLNYLKSCVREAFRVHPFRPFTPPRVAIADTTIAGYTVTKGSHVLISKIGLGRNTKVWTEPNEFRPERHMDNGNVVLSEPDLRFVSFGTGRRGCPGISLGTSITMILFARLLQGFTWTKPANIDKISLEEAKSSLALAKPLTLHASPRLAASLYKGK
ncbi:hypothetical protein GUJ93_ZPchr0003g16486 [Zizania palustris]|uniref:Cytochrome P450 n=1 Tax=Zizania palustris TaxID=103762 RepID=A0A8J5S2S2_ZIZPA|nr:hypothetical protein GUJ93_ZPchr0003g16486 [Zizania palustris]